MGRPKKEVKPKVDSYYNKIVEITFKGKKHIGRISEDFQRDSNFHYYEVTLEKTNGKRLHIAKIYDVYSEWRKQLIDQHNICEWSI